MSQFHGFGDPSRRTLVTGGPLAHRKPNDAMSLAEFALKRPYTIMASLMLICIMGIGAGLRMPVDIFPEIDIPVVSVVWTYAGMSPQDIQNRILTLHERQMASLVDDISRIEATSYQGVGVIRVYLHE